MEKVDIAFNYPAQKPLSPAADNLAETYDAAG